MGRHVLQVLCAGIALLSIGCEGRNPARSSEGQHPMLTLATTTSMRDTGLLNTILPGFREQTGIDVKVIVVGSGQAIEMGRSGDVDVLLTHSPDAEKEFVEDGFSKQRTPVFHNDFLLIGPVRSSLRGSTPMTVSEALSRISAENLTFVSRGDDSGTHRKEEALWKAAGINPTFSNYLKAGSGMAQTLRVAEEKQGWTIADRGTFLVLKKELSLTILVEGDPQLLNPYAVMLVDPARHPHVQTEAAEKFLLYLAKESTQKLISDFGLDSHGQPLFFVN